MQCQRCGKFVLDINKRWSARQRIDESVILRWSDKQQHLPRRVSDALRFSTCAAKLPSATTLLDPTFPNKSGEDVIELVTLILNAVAIAPYIEMINKLRLTQASLRTPSEHRSLRGHKGLISGLKGPLQL